MPSKSRRSSFEPVYFEIGRRIRWLRQQRGWSAATVAAKGGFTHQTTVTSWEVGSARPGIAELLILADTLGVPLERILSKLSLADCRVPEFVREKRKLVARENLERRRKNGTLNKKGKGDKNGQ